ncbi:hypothetical protein SUNI508_03414 [Seiridium unicorne]|uniref:Uncharacterized protein n=1 Tax=Seiridium unicorne TaxID=138068 RepID=A0ABR2VC90_9PEZI
MPSGFTIRRLSHLRGHPYGGRAQAREEAEEIIGLGWKKQLMSASSPPEEEISCFASETPFTPKPLIADILRTRYCIPGSIFLVEAVDVFRASSKSNRWRGIRLLLGDGQLCIQALLAGEMHSYVDRGDVNIGSYVKLSNFILERTLPEPAIGSAKGKETAGGITYLVVEDLITVGWNNRLLAMLGTKDRVANPHGQPPATPALHTEIDEKLDASLEPVELVEVPASPSAHVLDQVADAEDDFEALDVPQQKITQKRAEIAAQTSSTSDYSVPIDPENLPWSDVDPTKPLKLTPLRSIPNLPYKQNWSTNVLAVIASISDLQSSTLPPFTQRVARLAHPSTNKQVHLTVFLNADEFAPCVGSVVLLLGVKNHRFDGGSLKKYASDKPKNGERWWFDDPVHLTWCDVAGLKAWWHQNQINKKEHPK